MFTSTWSLRDLSWCSVALRWVSHKELYMTFNLLTFSHVMPTSCSTLRARQKQLFPNYSTESAEWRPIPPLLIDIDYGVRYLFMFYRFWCQVFSLGKWYNVWFACFAVIRLRCVRPMLSVYSGASYQCCCLLTKIGSSTRSVVCHHIQLVASQLSPPG